MNKVNSLGINSSSGIGLSAIIPVLLIIVVCGLIVLIAYKKFFE